MRRFLIALALMFPLSAQAQSDDAGFLTNLLQNSLSGAGRQVQITGFEGALSSRATIASLSIADDEGVWLALKDVVLDWQRADLLRGRLTINAFTAGEIDLRRMPQSAAPTAEAPDFSLPNLPLAINIAAVSTPDLRLGAPILGEPVRASIDAALSLADGAGAGQLRLQRTDQGAPQGRADVTISYANQTRKLDILLAVNEASGGILSRVLGIPDAPALDLRLQGAGVLDDFQAELDLRSNGVQRLGGTLSLAKQIGSDGQNQTAFNADMSGDMRALFEAQFQPFFGPQTRLRAAGFGREGGGFSITELALTSGMMQLSGALDIDSTGIPERFSLTGTLEGNGAPLVLPLALDSPAAVTRATLFAQFDAAQGETWSARADLQGWQQSDLRLAGVEIAAQGSLSRGAQGARVVADITYSAEGVQPARMSLSRAIGNVIWGGGRLEWAAGDGQVQLRDVQITGEDYALALQGTLGGLATGFAFDGALLANADQLGRFSDVLGLPLQGAGRLNYDGVITPLSGGFDGRLAVTGQDITTGARSVTALLQGQSQLEISARRGAQGIELRQAVLRTAGLSLDLAGQISGQTTALSGSFAMQDQPAAQRGFSGAVQGELDLTGALNDAVLRINAAVQGLALDQPRWNPALAGQTNLTAQLRLQDFTPRDISLDISGPQLALRMTQDPSGAFDILARLANLGLIFPEFPGALTVEGRAALRPDQGGADVDLAIRGPAQVQAQLQGVLGPMNALRLTGTAYAGLTNAFIAPRSLSGQAGFDLVVNGPLAPASVSGRVFVGDGRFADPNLPFGLDALQLQADITQGRAALAVQANSTHGGSMTVRGPVQLQPALSADLAIALRDFGLRDAQLYETTVSGDLAYTGWVGGRLSGVIDLGRTEVKLSPAALTASDAMVDIQHLAAPSGVLQTQMRAGIGQSAAANSTSPPIELALTVRATNRLFLRGRGLDAELGGELRLLGTTADVRPSGAFDLVRGRFEVLGKRLDLEEVRFEMQGQLVPYLSLRAVNLQSNMLTTVIIDGPAIDPEIKFISSPEMPEEDVIAQLLFDQNLQGLTPLQAVQMAGAVATLIGRGDGVVARIRTRFGLDNLDVQSDPDGATALKMGKYVSDKVYSELSVDSKGMQVLDFSMDVTRNLKLRAGAGSTGNVGIGFELETNY